MPSTGVFICPPHLFVSLLYLGKLSRPKYQQKLNEIMKISQEDVILIKKSLSVKAVWCTKAVEGIARQGFETLKHWQSATRRVQLSGFQAAWDRVCRGSSEKPCAQSGGKAKKASVNSLDFACHSLFKCIHKNNSPWSPAHMLQMMLCSAVVWSQSYLPSHSLISK